jgi:hypothetical protein
MESTDLHSKFGELWKFCPCLRDTPIPPIKRYVDIMSEEATFWKRFVEGIANVSYLGLNTTLDMKLWSR